MEVNQVALGVHRSAGDRDLQRRGHRPQRDPGARDQRLQQHVPGTGQRPVPAAGGMQARHRQRLAGGYRAADVLFAELTMSLQGDDGRLRVVPVGVLERLLHGAQGGAVHDPSMFAVGQ